MVIQWPAFYSTSTEAKGFYHISTLPKPYTLPCLGFCKCGSQRRESLAFEEPPLDWLDAWHGLVNKLSSNY